MYHWKKHIICKIANILSAAFVILHLSSEYALLTLHAARITPTQHQFINVTDQATTVGNYQT